MRASMNYFGCALNLGEMMRVFLAALAALAGWSGVSAQSLEETYAVLPSAWSAQISPNGNKLALGCRMNGVRAVCIHDLTGQTPMRGIAGSSETRILDMYWASDDYILTVISQYATVPTSSGNRDVVYTRLMSSHAETGETVMLLGDYGGRFGDLTNVTSLLTDNPEQIAIEVNTVRSVSTRSMSRLRDGDEYQLIVQTVDLDTGDVDEFLRNENGSMRDMVHDGAGNEIAAVLHDRRSGEYTIRRLAGGRQDLYQAQHEVELPVVYGVMDEGRALAVWIPGGEGLVRIDLETGVRSSFGEGVSRSRPILDRFTGDLVAFAGIGADLPARTYIDSELEGIQNALSGALPHERVVVVNWSQDRQVIIAAAHDIGRSTTYYLYDRGAGSVSVAADEFVHFNGRTIPVTESFSYTARDGLEIPAYLTLPPGMSRADGPFPLMLVPHGGPQARDTGRLDTYANYLAEKGYAVLRPNFRGSTGYGQAFIEAGHDEFADGMITDMIDGARYLISEGVAREDGYCAFGGSYGGYAALMLPLLDQGGVECAIAMAPVTEPQAMFAETYGSRNATRYWERYIGSRFGDDNHWAAISPAQRIGEYDIPLLLIHGEEDLVVPVLHSERFYEARGGRDTDLIVIEGENHYFDHEATRLQVLQSLGAFLDEHFPAQ